MLVLRLSNVVSKGCIVISKAKKKKKGSSTSSHDAFHGTAISLVLHPTTEKPGTDRTTDVFDPGKSSMSKKIASMPSYFTDVPSLTLSSTNIFVSDTSARLVSILDDDATSNDSDREEDWLENTRQILNEMELTKEDIVSWVTYRLQNHYYHVISEL